MKLLSRAKSWFAILAATNSIIGAMAGPLGTAFTYQGRLAQAGAPANGNYDFTFSVYDSPALGTLRGPVVTNTAVAVSNGLFTVVLDFGAGAFTGEERWLEIAVRNGTEPFSVLTPRQLLTPAPYAIQALNATAAASVHATNLIGMVSDAQLSTNVALLNSGPHFSGSISASNFIGSGAGLTSLGTANPINRLASTNDIYIFDGDSRTSSLGWPDYAMTNLFFAGRCVFWTNLAVSGTGMDVATSHYSNIVRALKPTHGENAYLFEAFGINDLLNCDAPCLLSEKSNYWRMARADGFKVITLTVPPASDGYSVAVAYPRTLYSPFDANRRRFNQLVRQSTLCDGVIDADAVINDPLNNSVYQPDGTHFQPATAVGLGAFASQYMLGLGRRNVTDDYSPLYPRWKATLPLKTAPLLNGCNSSPSLPGNDQGGVLGLYDSIAVTPGTNRSFAQHLPFRMGWTNLSVSLWFTTDSSNASFFSMSMSATSLNTNTLSSLAGPSCVSSSSSRGIINTYPQVQTVTFNLYWTNDYAPRQLWTQFFDFSGGANLTNNVYVLDMEATGY